MVNHANVVDPNATIVKTTVIIDNNNLLVILDIILFSLFFIFSTKREMQV